MGLCVQAADALTPPYKRTSRFPSRSGIVAICIFYSSFRLSSQSLVRKMYASVIALGSLLAAQAVVADNSLQLNHVLSKRQGDDQSFVPPTTPGCPSGWPTCGTSNVCYNPRRGDTCCPDGTCTYCSPPSIRDTNRSIGACPAGNFCLQQGLCCPDVRIARPVLPWMTTILITTTGH